MSKADPHRQKRATELPATLPVVGPRAGNHDGMPPVAPSTGNLPVPPDVSPMAPFLPQPITPAQAIPSAKPPTPSATLWSQPAPRARGSTSAPAVAAPDPDEEPTDVAEAAVKSAPPFLVSMLVHTVLLIVLALVTFSRAATDQLQLQAIYADSLGQQLLDDKLQSPESLDMKVDVPVLSFGLQPADDPLAAPPKLSEFFEGANRAAASFDAPNIGLALTGREVGMKKALLPVYGGSATTEGAVLAGLEWLKKQQMRDGGWSLVGPYTDGAIVENRCAATAMAILAFQGYGTTHQSSGGASPDFHDVVDRGWKFLLKMQDKDGFFQHDGGHNHRSYAQAQATIAICEIYGMTKDSRFKKPAQLALDFAHKVQSPELGGWRYQPRLDSDTSVTGWYVMAFQSGLMAGLEVQSPSLDLVNKFLDRVQHEGGSQYSYQIGSPPLLSMTAEALLCRQYLGWKHDDPRMRAGIDQLLANRINYDDEPNVYYWYYATQACHHMDGDDWNRWNERLRTAVPAAQTKTGAERGSWPSSSDRWGSHGGRLYTTCLSIFMLETYYRHLPIYKWRLQ